MAEIPSTPSDGMLKVVIIPAAANIDAVTLAEANAASAVDISCYLTSDGLNVSVDEAAITDERLCSKQVFEKRGRKTHGLELTYIDNTNSEDSAENEAADTLEEGTKHVILVRRGKDFDLPFAAGDIYNGYPIEAGIQRPVPQEANSVIKTIQKAFISSDVGWKKALVAP